MQNDLWAKMHGASVHFPIALVLVSFALDGTGRLFSTLGTKRGLHVAGYWTMLSGVAGTVPAVVSGLVMTKGALLGRGDLRLHHLFAWPAFALIVGTATWRMLGSSSAAEPPPILYVAAAGVSAALFAAAGYWGGEMLIGN